MLFVLPEVFTLVLGPSFDLPCLLATAILDSFSLFYLPNTSEVRGNGQQCQTAMAQEWPRGATPCPRSGGAPERSYPASKARGSGREELPHTPTPEARGSGWEKQPHIQGTVAAGAQEGLE